MFITRVLQTLAICLVCAGGMAVPARQRETPISMGLRLLGNFQQGMARTIQGLFPGGGRHRARQLPIAAKRPPRFRRPVEAIHLQAPFPTPPSNSFFSVVHEPEPQTLPPVLPSPTEGGFTPSSFQSANVPFQGNVDENTLIRNSEVIVGKTLEFPGPRQVKPHSLDPEEPSGFVHTNAPFRGDFDGFVQRERLPVLSTASPTDNGPVTSSYSQHLPQTETSLPIITVPSSPFDRDSDPGGHPREKKESQAHSSSPSFKLHKKKKRPTSFVSPKPLPLLPLEGQSKPSHAKDSTHPSSGKSSSSHSEPPVSHNTGLKLKVTPNEKKESQVSGYEFGYGVGRQFYHAEKKVEGITKGSYKVQLADGRTQTVTYIADDNGFHPRITYEGEAKFPKTVTSSAVRSR